MINVYIAFILSFSYLVLSFYILITNRALSSFHNMTKSS